MLAFLPFAVKRLEYRIVSGGVLDESRHNLKKCLSQPGRTTLGNMSVLRFENTRLAGWSIYTFKGYKGLLVVKAAHITDLCHELGTEDRANAKHMEDKTHLSVRMDSKVHD